MFRKRCLLVLAAAFACVAIALPTVAQEQKGKGKGKGGIGGIGGFGGRTAKGPLVTDEVAEKLNLSADQKSKLTKIEDEFKTKAKEPTDKLAELRQGGFNKDSLKDMQEQTKVLTGLRKDYTEKVTALFNDDQKKIFQEARPAGGGGFGGGGFGGGGGGTPGLILSPGQQDRLKLTQEQKDKLTKIQKDVDTKLNDLLTEEQRKQLENLKKGPAIQPKQPKLDLQQLQGRLQNLPIDPQQIQDLLKDLPIDREQIQELLKGLKQRKGNQ